jgi:eukaryotic-like serine/threonine-protein kinase
MPAPPEPPVRVPLSAEESTLPVGTRVGRYVVIGLEGEGATGIVYAAQDPELQRKVALKLLRGGPVASSGEPQEERLRREARALAQLSHPNVLMIHDVGVFGERIFIAMEYVEGQTLARWIDQEPRPWREVLARFIAAGRGLAAAHAAGLVHRDFKPENVLLGGDDRLRVADFGLARVAAQPPPPGRASPDQGEHPSDETLTATGAIVGTPLYMAPEQHLGQVADARSDQFSFCVALYLGLFRQRPFAGDSLESLADSVLEGQLRDPPPDTRVPLKIRRALERGLSVSPEHRFPSMDALVAELARQPRRRRPLFAAIAAAFALAGGAALGWYIMAPDSRLCRGSEKRLQGIWDAKRRALVDKALRGSGVPYAGAAVQQVNRHLDAYAAGWVDMHTEACVATRLEGRQTERQLGLRTTCLDGRLHQLADVVDRLLEPDREVVARVGALVGGLADLGDCANLETLARPVPLPSNPAARERATVLGREITRARSFKLAGRVDEALEAVSKLMPEVRAIGHRPLEADAHLLMAELREKNVEADQARKSYEQAVWAAEAGRHDQTAATALIGLLYVAGRLQTQHDLVPNLTARATAALERIGGDPEREASLKWVHAAILLDQGKEDDAERLFREALSITERAFGAHDTKLVQPLHGLVIIAEGRGRLEEALRMAKRMLAIQTRVNGASHPDLAIAHRQLANVERARANYREAEAGCRRALAIDERAFGPQYSMVASSLSCLAKALHYQGKGDQAVAHLRRAVAIREKALGREHPHTVQLMDELAWALGPLNRPEEVLGIQTRVQAIIARQPEGDQTRLAYVLHSIGEAHLQLGRADKALRAALESDALSRRALGDDYAERGEVLRLIGAAYLAKGQPDRAIAPLTRSGELNRKKPDPVYYLMSSALLGRALHDSGRDRERGRALAREARNRLQKHAVARNALYELERWMRRRGLLERPPRAR